MKKITVFMGILSSLFFNACSSSEEEPVVVEEQSSVTFYLDLAFVEGGSMSRSNSDVYTKFYNEKIKTKELIPDDYEISFTNTVTGTRYDFTGKWSNKDKITLLEGTYKVNGASRTSEMCSDKASITFTQDVEVNTGMASLTVTAGYECCLLMFNKSNITKLEFKYSSNTIPLFTYEDYYYCFGVNLNSSSSNSVYFNGERDNGSTFTFKVGENTFETGKYYFFNDVTSSFDVPTMEAGN